MHEKEPHEPPEHTSEHVKSQNFLGACPWTPVTQSILQTLPFVFALGSPDALGSPGCKLANKSLDSITSCHFWCKHNMGPPVIWGPLGPIQLESPRSEITSGTGLPYDTDLFDKRNRSIH